jgi:hypothetical protein
MSTLKALLTDKHIIAFIILNIADVALTLLLLSWGGTELNPIYSSLGHVHLIPPTKLAFVGLTLLALWNYRLLHLVRWVNIGMGLIVAFNITMVIGQLI